MVEDMSDDGTPGVLAAWRRSYGASPLHLLLHLIGIVLIAWALSQSFDARYSAAYLNLALWMVGGAIINDFVALPLYVGVDRLARGAWGLVAGTRTPAPPRSRGTGHPQPEHAHAFDESFGAAHAGPEHPETLRAARRTPLVRGNGHVRVPVAMSAVLLLVYFPNITDKAPIGHRLSTGLPDQPDFAARWLAVTAGLLIASAVLYGVRVAVARSRRSRAAA